MSKQPTTQVQLNGRHFDQLSAEEQEAFLAQMSPRFRDVGVWLSPPGQDPAQYGRTDEVAFWEARRPIMQACVQRIGMAVLMEEDGAA